MKQKSGFSLIELLVVMGIIALLAGLSMPAINKALRASNLNSGGHTLIDQLNLARQTARSRSLPVEVRLYKLPDYGKPSTEAVTALSGVYRAFQIFLIDESGATVAVAKPTFLLAPIVISAGNTESALLSDALDATTSHYERDPVTADSKLGIYGKNYRYIPFQFSPGGATDLGLKKNFVTLVLQNDKTLAEGANFFTVEIDPVNGSVRSFRP